MVIFGPYGKTIHPNVNKAIEEHGIFSYPFTPKKYAELEGIEKARSEAQTLKSILVSGDHDYVITRDALTVRIY